jgi:hypothetical protein
MTNQRRIPEASVWNIRSSDTAKEEIQLCISVGCGHRTATLIQWGGVAGERKKEGQRHNEIQREEEWESGGGKEGAMGAAVGEGRGKSIEDTTDGSKSEHTTVLSWKQARSTEGRWERVAWPARNGYNLTQFVKVSRKFKATYSFVVDRVDETQTQQCQEHLNKVFSARFELSALVLQIRAFWDVALLPAVNN